MNPYLVFKFLIVTFQLKSGDNCYYTNYFTYTSTNRFRLSINCKPICFRHNSYYIMIDTAVSRKDTKYDLKIEAVNKIYYILYFHHSTYISYTSNFHCLSLSYGGKMYETNYFQGEKYLDLSTR